MLEIAHKTRRKHEMMKKLILANKFITKFKHQYQKLYSTPPWHGAHTCKVLRKYSNEFSSYNAKTKRDGHDRWMGAFQYLPSRAFGATGDNNELDISVTNAPHSCLKSTTTPAHIWGSRWGLTSRNQGGGSHLGIKVGVDKKDASLFMLYYLQFQDPRKIFPNKISCHTASHHHTAWKLWADTLHQRRDVYMSEIKN